VYATQYKKRLSLFVISRQLAGYPEAQDADFTPVVVDLPLKSAISLTLYRMTGDATANNLKADNVQVEKLALGKRWTKSNLVVNQATGADPRGLPPSSVYLYVFDGVVPMAKAAATYRRAGASQQN